MEKLKVNLYVRGDIIIDGCFNYSRDSKVIAQIDEQNADLTDAIIIDGPMTAMGLTAGPNFVIAASGHISLKDAHFIKEMSEK